MTASLTPALALALLRELSVDVRSAVVLDPAGEPVAGEAALAAAARRALEGDGADGALHVARTPDGGAIALLAGDFALTPLLAHDLWTTAAELATRRPDRPET